MAEKVTEMLLKVHDLECSKCYKKVKKILCKFPQIHDQLYDEKKNTVRIKVVSCCPEKIRDKICCKGRGIIKSIEILKPPEKPHPKPEEKEKEKKEKEEKEKKEKEKKEKEEKEKKEKEKKEKKEKEEKEKKEPAPKPVDSETPKVKTKDKNTIVVNFFDLPKPCYVNPPVPYGSCCTECSEGRGGGPCYNPGYCGRPVCSCGCGGYGGNCGRPVCSCGCGGYRGNCEYYCSEDNSQGCTIM